MPIALKRSQLKYKNPETGAYVGVDAVAEKTTAEMISEVESAGHAKLTEINARATEVQASLPNVGEMEDIVAVPFVQSEPYPEGAYVIQTVSGVNYLYKLPDGHTAGVAWGEFTVDGPLTFSEELTETVKELVAVQDEQPESPENKVWLTETPPEPVVVPTYAEYNDTKKYVDDLLEHETYKGGQESAVQYEPVTEQAHVNESFLMINGYNYATIARPTNATVRIYQVELGKTYKVVGLCNNTTGRPLLVVADNLVESGAIGGPNDYDHVDGSLSTTGIDEAEYVAARNGYLYITASNQTCGLWEKITEVRYYYIDDLRQSVDTITEDVDSISETLSSVSSTVEDIGAEVESVIGMSDIVNDLYEHETYAVGGEETTEYIPIQENTHVDSAFVMINGYNYATLSTPTDATVRIYPVEVGKTYKTISRGRGSVQPLFVVADNVIISGAIGAPNTYDYVAGTYESSTVEEKEYTALRTGYLYLTASTNLCGLWEKKTISPSDRKYYIDDVMRDIEYIDESISKIDGVMFREKTDSSSIRSKVVPKNAEPTAKIDWIDSGVTLVRSILSRNVANKDAVGDVEINTSHDTRKGIRTAWLPSGRYWVDLGNMGPYTMVKYFEKGIYSTTLYTDQFPMKVGITDPSGGFFVVYAGSVQNLGDMSGLFIGRLRDDEPSIVFDAYAEKTYTPEKIHEDNRIEVVKNGLVEFVSSGNTNVASSITYTVFGNDDDTTTRKEFITSPDGSRFLPMVGNDGSVIAARVVPKKALFIGNSLTSGWQTFGEAASEVGKDFVGRFSSFVAEIEPSYSFNRKWSTQFEQRTTLADAQTWVTNNIDPLLSSDLDLIVVQLSDNVVGNASARAIFPSSSLWLLRHLREECPKARVIWLGVWFDRDWVKTLLSNTAQTGCEYVDMRPLYLPEHVSAVGEIYKMEADYTKEYAVDSFTVNNGKITLVFTVDEVQHTSVIPSYTSYTSSSATSISVTGIYHVVSTYYESIHPNDEGFRKIANKLLFDLGISDSNEAIPAT